MIRPVGIFGWDFLRGGLRNTLTLPIWKKNNIIEQHLQRINGPCRINPIRIGLSSVCCQVLCCKCVCKLCCSGAVLRRGDRARRPVLVAVEVVPPVCPVWWSSSSSSFLHPPPPQGAAAPLRGREGLTSERQTEGGSGTFHHLYCKLRIDCVQYMSTARLDDAAVALLNTLSSPREATETKSIIETEELK